MTQRFAASDSLRLRKLSTPRLTEFDQHLDADESPLVILQPLGHFLALGNERVDSFPEQNDVFTVFDDLAEKAHAGTCGVSSPTIASASSGWPLSHAIVSSRTWARNAPLSNARSRSRTSASEASMRLRTSRTAPWISTSSARAAVSSSDSENTLPDVYASIARRASSPVETPSLRLIS